MSSVQIPSIEFKDNRIQKCSFIIDKQTFNVIYSNDKYTVSKDGKSEKEAVKEEKPKEETKEEKKAPIVVTLKKPITPKVRTAAAATAKLKKTAKKPTETDIKNTASAFSKMV